MKESTMKFVKKVGDICEEDTIWKVFYVCYVLLFAANMLLSAFSKSEKDKKRGRWNAVSIGVGLGVSSFLMEKTEKAKQAAENE